ncbi:hypothetical protein CY652_04700 [Burkholderia sp. WAC0059]|uniref:hypothetical protein n=1 Tax=Burkholderia sp. WAC0059 TaxID=2066022 RepID=UPI000C7EDC69|nr:hypothetical protein [Burkholderia sp. WAC0059]PLZ03777.1 hypothetical protein CY652_04700 [Burkholderia sp. WAC0059]
MKGGVKPTVRLIMIGLATAGTVMIALESAPARALPSADRFHSSRAAARAMRMRPFHLPFDDTGHPASDLNMRPAIPPDLDERRRDGHMTPEERHLLRQHIEDAVRELYKR